MRGAARSSVPAMRSADQRATRRRLLSLRWRRNVRVRLEPLDGRRCDPAGDFVEVLLNAIDAGYRRLDCNPAWDTEPMVAMAIQHCPSPRDELFITTVVPYDQLGEHGTRQSVRSTRDRLGSTTSNELARRRRSRHTCGCPLHVPSRLRRIQTGLGHTVVRLGRASPSPRLIAPHVARIGGQSRPGRRALSSENARSNVPNSCGPFGRTA